MVKPQLFPFSVSSENETQNHDGETLCVDKPGLTVTLMPSSECSRDFTVKNIFQGPGITRLQVQKGDWIDKVSTEFTMTQTDEMNSITLRPTPLGWLIVSRVSG